MRIIFTKIEMIKKVCAVTAILVLVVFSGMPTLLVQAQSASSRGTYTLLEPLPCIPGNGVVCTVGTQIKSPSFETYVQYIFNLTIALAAVAAVFMIVWGGFQYMSSDSFSGKKDGLKKLQNAIYGLLLVLCSFLILKTIDPRLVAIPTTLVAPLADCSKGPDKSGSPLCTSRGSTGDFFDDLANEAEKYQVSINELANSLKDVKEQIAKNDQEKEELGRKLNTAYLLGYEDGDPEIEELKKGLADNANSSAVLAAQVPINSVNIAITAKLKEVQNDLIVANDSEWYETDENVLKKSLAIVDVDIKAINTLRDSGNSSLQERGQFQAVSQIGGINDMANYAEIILEATRSDLLAQNAIDHSYSVYSYKQSKTVNRDQLESELRTDFSALSIKAESNVRDPKLKAELKTRLLTSENKIKEAFPSKE